MVVRRAERLDTPESQQRRELIDALSGMCARAATLTAALRSHLVGL
jgi:hypothetical protein